LADRFKRFGVGKAVVFESSGKRQAQVVRIRLRPTRADRLLAYQADFYVTAPAGVSALPVGTVACLRRCGRLSRRALPG